MTTATPTRAPAPPGPSSPPPPSRSPGRARRLFRGDGGDPAWVRPALLALLAGTALLYLWNLSASGYSNDFYAAAVQAGTQSWKAWLFGSLDSGNAITVDKPPAALWVMVASARIFGFSSWSLLMPQALMGVGAVGLLYATVRRWAGPAAGLLAGAAPALTPAAVLMFRFDNPDALLTLLLVVAAWATARAVDAATVRSGSWWLVAAGSAIGFAFLTKMGQALLVVPALGLVHLLAGAPRLRTRIVQLLGALVAMVVSAGWFIALVEIWPASSRPYIGGSTTNSLLELALGYNGIGRLLGGSGNGGGGGGGGGNTGFGGSAGITRLFTGEIAYEVSWLLPAALVLLVAGLWATRRAPRTDRARAALVLWGGWMLVTALVFSFMSGTMHPYYTVALAPGIAGTVATGTWILLRRRTAAWARITLAGTVLVTGAWTFTLLIASSESFAWLCWPAVAVALAAAAALLLPGRRAARLGLVAALVAGLLGTGVLAVATASAAHSGSIPSVGTTSNSFAASSSGTSGGMGGPGGGGPGAGGAPPADRMPGDVSTGTQQTGTQQTGTAASGGGAQRGGGAGMGGGQSTSAELAALLKASGSTWSAATSSSQSAASLELASGTAVMSTGGWSGTDSAITLAEFQQKVAAGEIHYYVDGGMGGGGADGGAGGQSDSTSGRIAAWVQATFTATNVGGQTVYDLTG
ncbi:glycosyltransferase family 39 protein [Pseudonocardia phyllosphaerae]|uniref:glycosyltransferase family 39 protein n=1 Tax=Pseudonocardia phyllosphaerae TaxID=3390502 RepID=UPI0039794A33